MVKQSLTHVKKFLGYRARTRLSTILRSPTNRMAPYLPPNAGVEDVRIALKTLATGDPIQKRMLMQRVAASSRAAIQVVGDQSTAVDVTGRAERAARRSNQNVFQGGVPNTAQLQIQSMAEFMRIVRTHYNDVIGNERLTATFNVTTSSGSISRTVALSPAYMGRFDNEDE